eukprot:jgi/Mesvir1/7680/Mv11650-RA.1
MAHGKGLALLAICCCVQVLAAVAAGDFSSGVVGCGGFVVASPELSKLRKAANRVDYSFIKVQLNTPEGVVKYETECAPNGYYVIPVYDKGTFVIKINGPDGWTFEPSQVTVVMSDGASCGANDEDVSFQLTGFSVMGQVDGAVGGQSCTSLGEDAGSPTGVTVTLTPVDDKGSAMGPPLTALTAPGGKFAFRNVLTGRYLASASHPTWPMEGKPVTVDVPWDNARISPNFAILGYSLRAPVVAQGNGVQGVEMFLYSDDVTKAACARGSPPPSEGPLPGKQPLCRVLSNKEGVAEFHGVPCGRYQLVPQYRGDSAAYEVSPPSAMVTVPHADVALPTPFQVMGFSVRGRVVVGKGRGVPGASVFVNGKHMATTGTNGEYKVDQMQSGFYKVTAEKQHHYFGALNNLKVVPNLEGLPDIVAAAFDVCGKISVADSKFVVQRTVTLQPASGTTPSSGNGEVQKTAADGSFCFQQVPAGSYVVVPDISANEKAQGLLLRPSAREVQVVATPVLDADFSQARVAIRGRVVCLESPCPVPITVQLAPRNKAGTQTTREVVVGGGGRATKDSGKADSFVFEDVSPGGYELLVQQPGWCWDAAKGAPREFATEGLTVVEVGSTDAEGIVLKQRGYLLEVATNVDHELPVTVTWASTSAGAASVGNAKNPPRSAATKLTVPPRGTQVCLERAGAFSLEPKSCCRFSQASYGGTAGDASSGAGAGSPLRVDILATEFEVMGTLRVDRAAAGEGISAKELAVRVQVAEAGGVTGGDAGQPVMVEARPVEGGNGGSGDALVFEYSVWASLGQRLVLQPAHAQLLFYPQVREVTVSSASCQPAIPPFEARPGLMLSGRVTPPISGLTVTVRYVAPSREAQMGGRRGQSIAGSVAAVVTTDGEGRYSAGPLYDDASYEVSAAKEGYQITRQVAADGSGKQGTAAASAGDAVDFLAQQLGSLRVRVRAPRAEGADGGSSEGERMAGVLLSLSGDGGFRRNSVSGEDGTLVFPDLFPGLYYLRPLLKEYSFAPSSASVTIGDGDQQEVEFAATRVAFSVYGSVHTLNQKPLASVVVGAHVAAAHTGATSPPPQYEETVTDASGSFRLRGLLPGVEYAIRVKVDPATSLVERTSPAEMRVKVSNRDETGVNFLAFLQSAGYALSGAVEGIQDAWVPYTRVAVYATGRPDVAVSTTPLFHARFFEFSELPPQSYIVKVLCDHPHVSRTHAVQSETREVDLSSHADVGVLRVTARPQQAPDELQATSLLPVLLIAVIVIGFFSQDKLDVAVAVAKDAGSKAQRLLTGAAGGGKALGKPSTRENSGKKPRSQRVN